MQGEKNKEKHLMLQNEMNPAVFPKFETCLIWNLYILIRIIAK